MRANVLRQHLLPAAAYFGLACLAMYWIIFNLPDYLPGDKVTDYYFFHWNYWWVRHVLTTPGLNIYETNYVFAPATSNLALHTLALVWYPIWALVEPLSDTFTAVTVISLVAFTLNGYIFYLLLRREGVSYGLALVGGAMLELTPFLFDSLKWTNLNLYGWFWIPALILIWGKVADHLDSAGRSTWKRPLFWAVMLGVAMWAMVLTDLQYPLFALPVVVPYALLKIWQAREARSRLRLVGYGLLGGIIGLALVWFAGPLPYVLTFDRTGLAPTALENAVRVPFPLGFIWHDKTSIDAPMGAIAFPSFVVALFLNLRFRRAGVNLPKMRWFWAALSPLPLILAAGPFIMIGETQITMPYVWLHNLLGGMFRYPQRFAPVFLIPATLFVMMTLTPLLQRRNRFSRVMFVTVLLLLVIADSRMLTPFPIWPTPKRYAFYEAMGEEPYDYVVVEVPTGGASGEGIVGDPAYAALQFYGTIHGKRMVNGHISRVNTYNYYYMLRDDPMMSWLGQRRFLEPDRVRQQLEERIFEWPIGYIVIHRDLIWRDGPTIQEVLGFLNSLPDLLCPIWAEGDAVVYRTAWHPDGCPARTPPETAPGTYSIDIGTNEDAGHIGWGWHYAEEIIPGLTGRWTGEYPDTKLYLDLPPGEYEIMLDAQSFYRPRKLELLVNGVLVGDVTADEAALQSYVFSTPADVIGDGQNLVLTLAYDSTDSPQAVGQGDAQRELAILVDRIQFKRVTNGS